MIGFGSTPYTNNLFERKVYDFRVAFHNWFFEFIMPHCVGIVAAFTFFSLVVPLMALMYTGVEAPTQLSVGSDFHESQVTAIWDNGFSLEVDGEQTNTFFGIFINDEVIVFVSPSTKLGEVYVMNNSNNLSTWIILVTVVSPYILGYALYDLHRFVAELKFVGKIAIFIFVLLMV